VEKIFNMVALVLLKFLSAQTHNSSLPGKATTSSTAEPFKNDDHYIAIIITQSSQIFF
jgi:hypothetical protein